MGTQNSAVPVKIKLKSAIQHPGQETDVYELETEGTIVEKAGNRYLHYEEEQNRELIKTMIKLNPDDALVMRTGAIRMRLPLELNGRRTGTYANGPLAMDLLVVTKALSVKNEQTTGEFHVHYDMHSEQSLLGTYQLTIHYAEGTL
ncbi:DUF1934 domain-containing protein [Sporosarcina sp. BI001-red]|uniref:DUF1934 domain-containing protein n=1 Tax=Sporosarcina sp. BI001-red TaxID=2282866 RepID=UPI000E279FAC|nr:DUF1934 domain-containing protein [Sporosarcina sp. BI001-red]REB05940.1 DUF1934 domain-containing protein [Sporosarcina sp. BI001-red]